MNKYMLNPGYVEDSSRVNLPIWSDLPVREALHELREQIIESWNLRKPGSSCPCSCEKGSFCPECGTPQSTDNIVEWDKVARAFLSLWTAPVDGTADFEDALAERGIHFYMSGPVEKELFVGRTLTYMYDECDDGYDLVIMGA